MEWLIAIPFALMFALCAFMMLSMMVRGWLGGGRHGGHGMMMCMGHGADHEPSRPDKGLLQELKSERDRMDALIARTEPHISDYHGCSPDGPRPRSRERPWAAGRARGSAFLSSLECRPDPP